MDDFYNNTLDISTLPKFEEVSFNKLHPSYWTVCLLRILIGSAIIVAVVVFSLSSVGELFPFKTEIIIGTALIILLTFLFSYIGFRKKGYAFRTHDVLFQHGVIATNTIIIPYNRVQHVALHEGALSRIFNLAEIQIFTAGGKDSDIMIPGIKKSDAENIKQLLMGKIHKEL